VEEKGLEPVKVNDHQELLPKGVRELLDFNKQSKMVLFEARTVDPLTPHLAVCAFRQKDFVVEPPPEDSSKKGKKHDERTPREKSDQAPTVYDDIGKAVKRIFAEELEKLEKDGTTTDETGIYTRLLWKLGLFTSSQFEREAYRLTKLIPQDERAEKVHILLRGESGTGKLEVAASIHNLSPSRSKKNFVGLNCAGLHETLFESEMWGHVPGAYTGAIGSKRGLFASAHEGTL
jgi:transcriptional regulator of acetoin/glycerol metabolism